MIKYGLQCAKGHTFDGWFQSSAAYDKQAKRGLVTCPTCGSAKVGKALMAPNLGTRQNKKADRSKKPGPPSAPSPAPVAPEPPAQLAAELPAPQRALLEAMRELRREITKNAEYVGPKFADEARKIHHDEAPARGIYGEATAEEAAALHEEGVAVYPMPPLPEDKN